MIRDATRKIAEVALVRSGLVGLSRARLRHDLLVLAYHNIIPDDGLPSGERSLHLTRSVFASQLECLGETHEIVELEAGIEHPGGAGRPRAVITFDDAYAGALVLGVEELVRRAIPATVFVPPGLMGRTSFWWDDAVRSMEGSAMPTPIRERAITELGGRDDRVRERLWDGDGNLPNPPWWERPATVKILEEASRAPEIAFASHTWSHPNLETLSAEALREELRRPLRWLRDRFECAVPWLSYPYGRETALVRAEAEKAGYDGAFRIDGGWIRGSASDRFGLPRWNVPAGISAEGFLLRTGGLLCR